MSYTSPESTSRSRDLSNVSESLYGRQGSSHLGAIPVPLPLDFTPRDLPELQRLHAQMTVDNLRLWECLNIIRCNRRVNGIDVLYDVFSMTDKEFFLNYPAYAGYDESGSGALRNVETSGGNHSERYLQHLVMHNNRLILENGRLYVCIEMLSSDPSMIPDEVVCHIFALNEEEFIRRYPSIGIGNRITKLLAKIRAETRGRQQRSLSLPLSCFHRISSSLGPSLHSVSSGPSCSNNNDHISPHKTLDDSLPGIGLSSRRSWPFSHRTYSTSDITTKHQPKQGDNLLDTPPSPPRLSSNEFSSVARKSPPRSSFKLPSPQRQNIYISGRELISTYSDNVQPRHFCQSLAKSPVQLPAQRRHTLSPGVQSRAKSNNAVVPTMNTWTMAVTLMITWAKVMIMMTALPTKGRTEACCPLATKIRPAVKSVKSA
ncbi:uncharacterized protein LOC112560556 isoform X1 [Pomacea canaliculata]|uniref:uncharacterized protein LOC112560556 isoform X1 n=1 Tax=Pomacea canaliculata TaxID=400727 RepID=UPI000D72BFF3|nr:uncharacterized protein LOC112560556 isoform X1 [Pomacea canaliculata]